VRLVQTGLVAHYGSSEGRPLRAVVCAYPRTRWTVLTDGNEWYSAEVVWKGTAFVAYAVNGYADRETAEVDTLSRARECTPA
jgi:hypothetical protein